ncbi:MAG: hypothetical protein ABIH92_04130 [Nanoarchaeota archaeon]
MKMRRERYASLSEAVNGSLEVVPQRSRGTTKIYSLSTFMHERFPSIVGLYQAKKSRIRNHLSFYYSDSRVRAFLDDLFFDVFGELPSDRPANLPRWPDKRRVMFCSNQVLHVVRTLTGDNSHPPYSILDSLERKVNYLGGFLYRAATVTYGVRPMASTHNERRRPRVDVNASSEKLELLKKIKTLMARLSIRTKECIDGLYVMNVRSLNRIVSLGLLSPSAGDKLEGLLDEFRNYWSSPDLVLVGNPGVRGMLNRLGRKKADGILERNSEEIDEEMVRLVEQAKRGRLVLE